MYPNLNFEMSSVRLLTEQAQIYYVVESLGKFQQVTFYLSLKQIKAGYHAICSNVQQFNLMLTISNHNILIY